MVANHSFEKLRRKEDKEVAEGVAELERAFSFSWDGGGVCILIWGRGQWGRRG